MDILKPLTAEQEDLANRLDSRQLAFANLILTAEEHGMSATKCYVMSGYVASDDNVAKACASRLRRTKRVDDYIRVMRGESLRSVGLTLEYLDSCLAEILDSNLTDTEGTDLKDLPADAQRSIQAIEYGKYGRKLRSYSRLDALRLAYQRHGALTDRKELTGANGGPIEVNELSDTELTARIQRLLSNASGDDK